MNIVFDSVSLGYVSRQPIVQSLSGCFEAGQATAVLGSNGVGKSTLLKSIMGFVKPLSGTIYRQNGSSADVVYMPQYHELNLSIPVTVHDFLALIPTNTAWSVEEVLRRVELSGVVHQQLGSLSIGQLQRVLFARLMRRDAACLLLDEPLSAVDRQTVPILLDCLQQWTREGKNIVVVLHGYEWVRNYFHQVLFLSREQVFWGHTRKMMEDAKLREVLLSI